MHVGALVGPGVGATVGAADVGDVVGDVVGLDEVGEIVGAVVGIEVVGLSVGDAVGSELVGDTDGDMVGESVPTAAIALDDTNCCSFAFTVRGEDVLLAARRRASVAVIPLALRKLTVLTIDPARVRTWAVSVLMVTVPIVRLAKFVSNDASKSAMPAAAASVG